MGRADINVWARRFAEDLNAAGTRVLFERVVARHLDDLGRLRELGLSWPAISGALVQAGVRRPDGAAVSTDQLRAAYSRLMKRNGQDGGLLRRREPAPSARAEESPDRSRPSPRVPTAPSQLGNRADTIRERMRRARDLRRDRSED